MHLFTSFEILNFEFSGGSSAAQVVCVSLRSDNLRLYVASYALYEHATLLCLEIVLQ